MKIRNKLFAAILICLISSPAWATPIQGELVGWGWNIYGQSTVPAGNNFVAISAGGQHSLALKSDGSLVGWGYNSQGQATVPAGNNFVAIAAGGGHSLAIRNVPEPASWLIALAGTLCLPVMNCRLRFSKRRCL